MSADSSGDPRLAHDIGDVDAEGLAAEVPEVLPDRAPDGVRRRSYDRAFEPAVARGLLTVQAAWARGSREAYAVGLQHRYGITPELALHVADNRMSLLEALETLDRQKGQRPPETDGAPVRRARRFLRAAVLASGLLYLAALSGEPQWTNQERIAREVERSSFRASAKARAASAARKTIVPPAPSPVLVILRDEDGRVTRVSGRTAQAVLDELCRMASASGSCPWMEVRHTEPRHAGLRVGLFQAERKEDAATWSVLLRRNRSADAWVAGTGLRPIEPFPADRGPAVAPLVAAGPGTAAR